MLHELQELEARVLRLDRAIQGISLAKTILPVIHGPGRTTHAEIFAADEGLDTMERKIGEIKEILRQLAAPSKLPGSTLCGSSDGMRRTAVSSACQTHPSRTLEQAEALSGACK